MPTGVSDDGLQRSFSMHGKFGPINSLPRRLRHYGGGRYRAFSAGSMPAGTPNPAAIATLEAHGLDHSFARSSWDEFAGDAAAPWISSSLSVRMPPAVCPVWPGHPYTVHWGVEAPPRSLEAGRMSAAFSVTYEQMKARVDALLALGEAPLADLMPKIREIGNLP